MAKWKRYGRRRRDEQHNVNPLPDRVPCDGVPRPYHLVCSHLDAIPVHEWVAVPHVQVVPGGHRGVDHDYFCGMCVLALLKENYEWLAEHIGGVCSGCIYPAYEIASPDVLKTEPVPLHVITGKSRAPKQLQIKLELLLEAFDRLAEESDADDSAWDEPPYPFLGGEPE